MNPTNARPGFTLLELLVVMSIVTLLAGVLGLALREGSPARSLESAQTTVASLLAVARSQAVIHQNRAMLVINADPADDRFLRGVYVAVESAPNSELWWITEHGAVLARGIYVMPGGADMPGVTYATGGTNPGTWPNTRRSSLAVMPGASISPEADNPAGRFLGMIAPLAATGRAGGGGNVKLVLAVARRTPAGVIFENPEQVRGVVLSSYGVGIFVHDPAGLDF